MSKKTSTLALDTLLRRRLRWAAWTVLACGLAAGSAAWWSSRQARAQNDTPAAVFTVTNTNDAGTGSLRDAIAQANAGTDTINFSSLFNTPQTIPLTSGELTISSSLTINGPGANLLTVQRSNTTSNFRIFTIGAGLNIALSGLTITGGRTADGESGGGISSGSNLTLTGVVIANNQAHLVGGGVSLGGANAIFTNCTINGNIAGLQGGGIYYGGSNLNTLLRVVNSTVSGNRLTTGGGIGAGIVNLNASNFNAGSNRLEVVNSTIANNITTANGTGGIATTTFGEGGTPATTTLRNSIIANNQGRNLSVSQTISNTATIISQGFNLTNDNGDGFLNQPTDILNKPPFLGLLADNGGPTQTHALLLNSPALDTGDSSGSITDQRGLPRPVDLPGRNAGDGADIGAFEAQTVPPLPGLLINDVAASEGNSGTTNFSFNVSLTAAVAQPVTAQFATADGTATAGSDYVAANGTVTFAPGEILKTITVQVNGDTMFEPDETFFVNLSNPVNAEFSDGQGQGTILDNEFRLWRK